MGQDCREDRLHIRLRQTTRGRCAKSDRPFAAALAPGHDEISPSVHGAEFEDTPPAHAYLRHSERPLPLQRTEHPSRSVTGGRNIRGRGRLDPDPGPTGKGHEIPPKEEARDDEHQDAKSQPDKLPTTAFQNQPDKNRQNGKRTQHQRLLIDCMLAPRHDGDKRILA